jgi:Ser/Thr protein kinase RdoA (MazF antagonist)
MNSVVVGVALPVARYVAKWVPEVDRAALHAGARASQIITRGGLAAGEPVLTRDGSITVDFAGGVVVLMSYVPGAPLQSSPRDQALLGETLARAHMIAGTEKRSGPLFPFLVDPATPGSTIEPWVRLALASVQAEYRSLPPLTWGLLHGDPAPEAFRLDPETGRVGLIDWAATTRGPLLYDVASTVMYLGGDTAARSFLGVYAAAGPLPTDEMGAHLSAMRRYRGAVQAAYFAGRLARHDLTGIADEEENWKGLHDARDMLKEMGMPALCQRDGAASRSQKASGIVHCGRLEHLRTDR